ncbi:MAG: hypothetical protein KIT09_15705 [Bryobacteraceae bacterium]|nr:hypothetical protein [Bryobacteraceae bacterium]
MGGPGGEVPVVGADDEDLAAGVVEVEGDVVWGEGGRGRRWPGGARRWKTGWGGGVGVGFGFG